MGETKDVEDNLIMDNQTTCDWSKRQTLALIIELKKYPCLYSKLDKDYSNLTQKNEKRNLMVEKLKDIKPDVTFSCVKRKIATLQRQLLTETIKKKELGNLYQPKLWCYDELFFLFKRTTNSQFEIIVDFMIQHLSEENRQTRSGYVEGISTQLWQTLTDKLNADGIPKRSLGEWKKVWTHYICRLIKKVRQYKKDKITTGGGPSKMEYFTALEQAGIGLLDLKVDLNEDFKRTTNSQFEIIVDFMIQHLSEENRQTRSGYVEGISTQLWQTLTDKLNADGIPKRSLGEWKKVWTHYICRLIKKVRQYKKDKITTGGGPSKMEYFTALEQAGIGLLDLKVDLNEDDTKIVQCQLIVDFMIQHKEFARENSLTRDGHARRTANQLWQNLTDKLNKVGRPNRSVFEWKRWWIDYKYKLKKKIREYNINMKKTGGGPSKTEYFTALQLDVIDLFNYNVTVNKDIQHKEFARENPLTRDVHAKRIANQLWKTLTNKLNKVGRPKRSVVKWKKWWLDYKYKLKKKIREYNINMKKTGGGPSKTEYFTALQLDVIDLFNYNITVNKDVMPDSDKDLLDKYILLETIVHEWTQRCQKYNFSLTDYAIRRKALVLANIIEMKDFDASPEWITNFKKKFKIESASETTEVIVSASTALGTVNIYDVAHDLRMRNKFPERVSKIYDEKFKHKDSIGEHQPVKKKRKLEPNLNDLTETYEEDAEIFSTNSDSQIISNIEFQTSKSQDLINDINVTTCLLTEANPSASSLIQLNKKFPMTVLSVSAKSLNSESSSVNNNMNLKKEDVVPIQSLVKESIISEKTSKESSNKKNLLGAEDIQNLLRNYSIKLEDIPISFIPFENEEVVVMDTSENSGDTQLDTNCEVTDLITICKDEVLEADISEIINLDQKFTVNKFEETIENENHDVSTNKKFPPIKNYEEALIHLKILEDFALVECNFRAIHFISNLEDILKKIPET